MPQSGGQNQTWPTSGRIGDTTLAIEGDPRASERGTKSEVAHKWVDKLHHPCRRGGGVPSASRPGTKSEVPYKWADGLCIPCRLGDPQRFTARDKIRRGPQVSRWAP